MATVREKVMKKMILEARVNEYATRDENSHVPWTPDEIAETAARCREAGASIVHFHARKPDGSPEHSVEAYAEIIRKSRAKAISWSTPRSAGSPTMATRRRAPAASRPWRRIRPPGPISRRSTPVAPTWKPTPTGSSSMRTGYTSTARTH